VQILLRTTSVISHVCHPCVAAQNTLVIEWASNKQELNGSLNG
jgi:hypothetical protein